LDLVQQYALIALALAADTAARLRLIEPSVKSVYFQRLSVDVRQTLENKRRCTCSWQTDTSSMKFLRSVFLPCRSLTAEKMTFADLTPHMLLSAILYVTVCPNGELFNRMSLHTLCDEDITVEHFMERFNACAPGASSPIPVHLATGMRGTLNRFPGNSAAEQASQYASWLSNKREEVWQAIHDLVCVPPASGGINYDHLLLLLAKDFMVPKLRAVMLLRFLHCL